MSQFTITDFMSYKQKEQKITMLTAYDFYTAQLAEEAGVDILLVGDSLGMVIQGESNTLSVTLDEIIYHSKAVRRGAPNSFIIGDLPYLTYHLDVYQTIKNAGRLIQESKVNAVKLELNHPNTMNHLENLISAQIPVIAHIGMTPQSFNIFGGFRVQGKNEVQIKHICNLAIEAQTKGACAVVVECVPPEVTMQICKSLDIPVIGIGAGAQCDGQVLVINDLLGITPANPKFAKTYVDGRAIIKKAIGEYVAEVKSNKFPTDNHSF